MTEKPAFTAYQRKLFFFLSVATFFEGYDFFAITQVLPHLRAEFLLSKSEASYLLAAINFGTVLAYLLVGKADRWGRKSVLSITILGYATMTALSGLAPNVWWFALFQTIARVFLIGEWATSMVICAEEYPKERRGLVLGVVGASAGLGSVVCAGVVTKLTAAFGWRSVYLVGILPLFLIAFWRRGLRETERFAAIQAENEPKSASIGAVWRSAYRGRALQLAAIWFLTYIATQNAVSVWKDYAMSELHLVEKDVGKIMTIAGLSGMLLVFLAGPLIDKIGRRGGATVILTVTALGVLGCYSAHSTLALLVSVTLAVFGVSAVLTVLNAFTTELFPTKLRGSAFALANNVIGRTAYFTSPVIIGHIAETTGWAVPLRITAVFPLVALVLVWLWLPETRGKSLEELAPPSAKERVSVDNGPTEIKEKA